MISGVITAEGEALVGMALLDGYELKVQVRNGGRVTIKALPQRKGVRLPLSPPPEYP